MVRRISRESVVIVIILSFIIYFWKRLHYEVYLYPQAIFIMVLFTLILYTISEIKYLSFIRHISLTLACILFIFFSYSNFRGDSWDGNITYFGPVYLTRYGNIDPQNMLNPIRPFPVQLVMGYIWKIFSLNIMNVTIGAVVLLSLFLLSKLYSIIGIHPQLTKYALISIFTAPMMTDLFFVEFKLEPYLLLFSILSYIVLIRFLERKNNMSTIILALLLGITCLIKFTFIIVSVMILAIMFYELYLSYGKSSLPRILITLLLFIFPLVVWIRIYGAHLSYIGYISRDFHIYTIPKSPLTINKEIYTGVEEIRKTCDYERFLPNTKFVDVFLQPINYILNICPGFNNTLKGIFDPGLIILLGVFFFPLLVLYKEIRSNKIFLYFYIIGMVYILIYFIFVRTVYWYLMPVIPIILIVIPYMVSKSEYIYKNKIIEAVLKAVVYFAVSFTMFAYLFMGINDIDDIPPSSMKSKSIYFDRKYELGVKLDELSKNGDVYVLNNTALTPYIKNYSSIVNYVNYFVSSDRDIDEMFIELKSNGIKYLLGYDFIYEPSKEFICSEHEGEAYIRELDKWPEFSEKYTKEIYRSDGAGVIYEIL